MKFRKKKCEIYTIIHYRDVFDYNIATIPSFAPDDRENIKRTLVDVWKYGFRRDKYGWDDPFKKNWWGNDEV